MAFALLRRRPGAAQAPAIAAAPPRHPLALLHVVAGPAHSLPLLHDPSTRYPLPPSFVGHHFRSPSLLRERPRGSSTLPSLASRPSRTRSLAPASLSRTPPAITIITVIIDPSVACPRFLQLVIDSAPRHLTAGALTFDLRPLRLKWLRITLATIARQLCERSPDSLRCGPR